MGGEGNDHHLRVLANSHSINAYMQRRGSGWAVSRAVLIGGLATHLAQSATPPVNDAFTNAIPVTGNSLILEADLTAATLEPFESAAGISGTAWWRWTAPTDGLVEWVGTGVRPEWLDGIRTSEILSVFTRDGQGQLHLQSSSMDRGSFQTKAAQEYFLQVNTGWSGGHGQIIILPLPPLVAPWQARVELHPVVEPAPANDSFIGRTVLTGVDAVFGGSLRAATEEDGEPPLPGTLRHTRWWSWTAPGNGTVRLQNLGTNTPAVIGIYRQGTWYQLESIANSATEFGNGCQTIPRGRETLEWDTVAGEDYAIQLDRAAEGEWDTAYSLQLSFTAAPENDAAKHARELTGNDLSLVVNNFGATTNPGDPVLPKESGAGSVWFRWTLPGAGIAQVVTNEPIRYHEPVFEVIPPAGTWSGSVEIRINTGGGGCGALVDLHPLPSFLPMIGLYQGSVSPAPGQPAALGLLASGTNGAVAEISNEVWIQLDGHLGTSGSTPLNLLFTAPPANDEYENRIVLPSAAVNVGGRTFAATRQAADLIGNRTVWWEWQAPSAGRWVLRPKAGQYDHEFIVAPGPTRHPLAESFFTDAAPVMFTAAAGDVFTICVTARSGFGDNVSFTLEPVVAAALEFGQRSGGGFDPQHPALLFPASFDLPFQIEASTNLIDWQMVTTRPAYPGGIWLDTVTNEPAARFYRTRVLSP